MIKINKNLVKIVIVICLIGIIILIASKIYPIKEGNQVNDYDFVDNSKNEQRIIITASPDMQRKIDLVNLSLVLESYKKEKGKYPITQGLEKIGDNDGAIYSLSPVYIKNIPSDIKDSFYYGYSSDGKTFSLTAQLENVEDIGCQKVEEICLYKINDNNNNEELLKIIRENLNYINSVRVISSSKLINQIGDNDPIKFFDEEKITNELLIDFVNKRKYSFSYQTNEGIDNKISEVIIIDGKNYIKDYTTSQLTGLRDWIEVKEDNILYQIPDSHSEFFSGESQFSEFNFIKYVSKVEEVKTEIIRGREYYHLSIKPMQKEKNDYLSEVLKSNFDLNNEELEKLFLYSSEKSVFPDKRVFKFYLGEKELVIPFSKFITHSLYAVLLSEFGEHSYKINTLSIKGDLWVDKNSLMPLKENNKFIKVNYYYDKNDKSFSFEMIFETETDKQYFDINKNFDINVPKIARVENSEENKEISQICDQIQNSFTKNHCINVINNKDNFTIGKNIEDCEKIPHSTWEKNEARDDCFLGLLRSMKDTSLCDKVEDNLDRVAMCYKEAAKISGDASFCQKLGYDYIDNWCKDKSSVVLRCRAWNEFSKDLLGRDSIDDDKKHCLALANRSESECKELKEDYQKARCISDIAEIKKDISLCDKIKNDYNVPDFEINNCYMTVAVATNNLQLCDKSGNNYNNCVIQIAVNSRDENICEKISGNQEKDGCYLGIVYKNIQY